MEWRQIFGLGALLVMSSGCTPVADNRQSQRPKETPPASTTGESTPSSTPAPSEPASHEENGSPDRVAALPFIAETKSPVPVLNVLSPGRLEVVDGCLTVLLKESERATAVFPPGVKPKLEGDEVVAVSFQGHTIPLNQEAPIPGGGIRLSSADLVKPIPSYCPKTLFGLGG